VNSIHLQTGKDWRSVLLAIASIGGALMAAALAVIVVVSQAAINFGSGPQNHPLLDTILLASAILFVGALLIPAAYFSVRRLTGEQVTASPMKKMNIGAGLLVIAVWLGIVALTQIFYGNSILRWITPPFYVLSIGLPVYFFARLAIGGLNAGSKQRTWGALGSGMILGPALAMFIELTFVLILLIGAGVYLAFHPELRTVFNSIREQIGSTSNPDNVLNLISPYLLNPVVIFMALLFFSVIGPVVEESAKSLTTWTIFDHLSSPAQGFVIGALSGTGFGLVESLLASVQPDSSWAVTLLVRGGTTMMHIVTAGLTGWGIAYFHVHKRAGWMVALYALAMFLHGVWNASVVVIVVGATHMALGAQSTDVLGILLMILGIATLSIIALSIPIALGVINWRLRISSSSIKTTAAPSIPTPITIEDAPRGDEEGKTNREG
jgi:RsiW-degrading membrane proteinase PrsW (M82 family)